MEKLAKGTRGFLIFDFAENVHLFRVYDEDHNFKDYKISHFDLEVEITDESAVIFDEPTKDGLDGKIDYSRETLGL